MFTYRNSLVATASLLSLLISGCATPELLKKAEGKKDGMFMTVRAVKQAYKSTDGTQAVFCLSVFDGGTNEEKDLTLRVPLNDKDKWQVKQVEPIDIRTFTDIEYEATSKDLSPECSPTQSKIPVVQLAENDRWRRIRQIRDGRLTEHLRGPETVFVAERYPKQLVSISYVSAKPLAADGHVLDVSLDRKFATEAPPEPKPYLYALLPFSIALDAVVTVITIPVVAILALTHWISGP